MTGGALFVTALTFILALTAAWMLVAPFFSEAAEADEETGEQRSAMILRKEQLYSALEELEHEFRTGKIDSADYDREKRRLMVAAADCLKQLEQIEGGAQHGSARDYRPE